ncbi:peptide chain release factor 2 [Nitzschia inconspicua]|uniref:Peptide chain release factor 2 n=1 Tax=Nitzschia inconspicua TaxID=303405 RepID=A0A9K3KDL4_9STRA|nr:peptide chain release factor 2 [Nitzschia inconspicua]
MPTTRSRNAYVTSQLSKYRRLQQRRNDWTSWKEDGDAALEMLQAANADDTLFSPEERLSLARELEECSHKLIQEGDRYQLELLLSGPYDDQPCRILLTAGAGGTEANDWVADLKRMYERHAQKWDMPSKSKMNNPATSWDTKALNCWCLPESEVVEVIPTVGSVEKRDTSPGPSESIQRQ